MFSVFGNLLLQSTAEKIRVISDLLNVRLEFDGSTCLIDTVEIYGTLDGNVSEEEVCAINETLLCPCTGCYERNVTDTYSLRFTLLNGTVIDKQREN